MRMLLILLLVVAPSGAAFAEFCESVALFPQFFCGLHPMIETRCWDGVGAGPDIRFEGYAQHTNGTLQHVKVTCGDADSYLPGYLHFTCESGNVQFAAAATELSCCGPASNTTLFNDLCPTWTFQSTGMPCPDGCFP